MDIKTRFYVVSDTHGKDLITPTFPVDVAIHCGDLTDESKIDEFRLSVDMLKSINAPLKLVIAGNHDFTLDTPLYQKKAAQAISASSIEPELIKKEYGDFGEARQLFSESDNILFLDEGVHHCPLQNGANLTVYASPYTPSLGDGGFQFNREDGHKYAINNNVDVVITHGPPRGVLDLARYKRGGCEYLFAAVARARSRLHCFGHIHEGWGAKLVAWRGGEATEFPSHFTDIDNGSSTLVESLATLHPGRLDTGWTAGDKKREFERLVRQGYTGTSHCADDQAPLISGRHTLFVNAAVESLENDGIQLPWIVVIDLPRATN
ncbi:Metallo-dependent phosphatase [Coniochaeta hoffmannii]|uniref:Metallo-dependent phosphatase n=1 Tax=Coniochaeta hoffmannii TaxID=91930 RepID=A0AA38VKT4_9PEZI|nr:Metallo-dependent phosphatase [Coniochaeta hoffmannii]